MSVLSKLRKRDIIAGTIFIAAIVGRGVYRSYQQFQSIPAQTTSFKQARADHTTNLLVSEHLQTGPLPDIYRVDILEYTSYEGPLGAMGAIASFVGEPGSMKPAVVWVNGGFSGTNAGDSYDIPTNDQGIASFLDRDIIIFKPTLRGMHENPGVFECFYGEVDDIVAAVEHVSKRQDVDPERIYLMGHSTGGTNVLLASLLTDIPAGVVSFGGAPDLRNVYYDLEPYDISDSTEIRLRSAILYTKDIKIPVLYIEGESSSYSYDALKMEKRAYKIGIDFNAAIIQDQDHYSVLRPAKDLLADRIQAGIKELPSPEEIKEYISDFYNNPDTELFSLVYSGTPAQIQRALKNGANPNATNPRQETPLMIALRSNLQPEAISALLKAGANPNMTNDEGGTALIIAVTKFTDTQVLSSLLDAGAQINTTDDYGNNALHVAAALSSNPEIIKTLVEAGADLFARDENEMNAIMVAAEYNAHPEIIIALIAAGSEIDSRSGHGVTPLIWAAAYTNNPKVIEVFLQAGADATILDMNGKTALDYAIDNEALNDTAALKMLEEATK